MPASSAPLTAIAVAIQERNSAQARPSHVADILRQQAEADHNRQVAQDELTRTVKGPAELT